MIANRVNKRFTSRQYLFEGHYVPGRPSWLDECADCNAGNNVA